MKKIIKVSLLTLVFAVNSTLTKSSSAYGNFGQACASSGYNYNDCLSYMNVMMGYNVPISASFKNLAESQKSPTEGCQNLGFAACAAAMQAQCQGTFCSFVVA